MSEFDPDFDLDDDPLSPAALERRRKKRRKMSPDRQAADIIDLLEEAIENNKDPLGKGMRMSNWRRMAKQEIALSIRNVQTDIRREEKQSGEKTGRQLIRGGFMLMAACASFFAFWGGIALVGKEFGLEMGLAAAVTALVLSMAFVWLGLTVDHLGLEPGSRGSVVDPEALGRFEHRGGGDDDSPRFDPARLPTAPTRRWLKLG
ncbi:MAG: hypothetical protein NXI16_03490 [Alphaproteobacteria bacterium]|nr:hypothetical protein [Alphaproteobacteria bacterium]